MTQIAKSDAAVECKPLHGVRVIDIATNIAAPLTAAMLADYGADVIKVEHPDGDTLRTVGAMKENQSLYWKVVNRNKRNATLRLSDPAGAEILKRLVADADVLIENFRPGTLEKWGLGPDVLHAINPNLIIFRLSGFGQTGPYSGRGAFGTVVEAVSGWAYLNGEPGGPPLLPPVALADHTAGMAGASLVSFALLGRELHGQQRQVVDFALYEPMLIAQGPVPSIYDQLGQTPTRTGSRSRTNAPRGLYLCGDNNYIAIASSSNRIAAAALQVIGREDLTQQAWFQSGSGRAAHADEIDEAVQAWVSTRSVDEAVQALADAGVPAAPVNDAGRLFTDPQLSHRESLVRVQDPELGEFGMQNVVGRFKCGAGEVRWAGRPIGANTDEVFNEFGIDEGERTKLREAGVI